MPHVTFDRLVLGEQYDRPELATMWGYQDWHAIGRGAVTPAEHKVVVLFVTTCRERPTTPPTCALSMPNRRAPRSTLFHRDRHHSTFIYYGQIHLRSYDLKANEPSRFAFTTVKAEATSVSAIAAEERAHGIADEESVPDAEGRRIVRHYVTYERSPRNRARALEIHGAKCLVCCFDFNEFYRADLAREYIEVHHTRSITEVQGDVLNPETDLDPICSNCHSMAHRERGRIIPLDELKAAVKAGSPAARA
jgi:5-methylcytosine-specific restriction protein A